MARTSFADYQATRYFFPLDGLRALSAALVVTWHTRDSPLEFLQGERGVTVFFVLSGYLITMLALREEESKGALSIKGFFLRRVFRILPLYYIVLAAYAVLVHLFDADKAGDFNAALPYYLLYFSEVPLLLNEVEVPFNHSWSLGIEEKFYMVWPFLAFGFMKSSRFRLPLSLILGSLLLASGLIWPHFGHPVALIEPYGHILIGAAMAFALHNKRWFERLGFLQNPATYWVLGLICVVLGVTEARWAFELLAFPTALFVGAMVLQPRHTISRALGFGPLAWLGTLSYAVYLIHPAVLGFAERLIPSDGGRLDDILTLIIGYTLSVGISVVLHRMIEKPFIAWGRKFDKSRLPAAAPAAGDVATDNDTGSDGDGDQTAGSGSALIDLRDDVAAPVPGNRAARSDFESANRSLLGAGPLASGQSAQPPGVPNGNGGHRSTSASAQTSPANLSFAPLPPAVAWGSGAWVEARGTATVRRSSGAVALESAPRPVVSKVQQSEQKVANGADVADAPAGAPDRLRASTADTLKSEKPAEELTRPDIEPALEQPAVSPEASPKPAPDSSDRRSKLWPLVGLLAVVGLGIVALFGYFFGPDSTADIRTPAQIDDVRVDGRVLVDGTGEPLRLQGVTQAGAQYACAQGWGIFDGAADQSSAAAMTEWGVNAVRLPLNEHCWLGTQGVAADFSGQNYQDGVLSYVDTLRAQGHAVVLSLDWSGTGVGGVAVDDQGMLPNAENSGRFWQSVADEVGDRPGVLFELFASPVTGEGACLTEGCAADDTVYLGFQPLIDTVRATGSDTPIILTAPAPGIDSSLISELTFADPTKQLIIGFKAIDGPDSTTGSGTCAAQQCWEDAADAASPDNGESSYPGLAISLATAECSPDAYSSSLERLESLGVSVFVPGWNTWDACGETPALLADADFNPTPMGQAVIDSFR